MEHKHWGPFNGTQLTILLTAAILAVVPTVVWSVDAFTNVAIQDPINGKKVAIDLARRMFVYDQVADQDETPANFVRAFAAANNTCHSLYTIPAGKALIIKSVHAYMHKLDPAVSSVEIDLTDAANCGGDFIGAAVTSQAHESKVMDFGSGMAIPSGHVISVIAGNNSGSVMLYGYLVPAGWVPASAPAVASAQHSKGMSPTMISPQK